MTNFKIGDKVLITTNEWFYAPNGQQYRAVFGTVKAINSSETTLGVKTNARSTNWYAEIGNMLVAGCQIHYAVKTNSVNLSDKETWEVINGECKIAKSPSCIYNADEEFV